MTSGVPQDSALRPLPFRIFISDIDSGIECSLNEFTGSTKLSGVVGTPKGQDIIQRDPCEPHEVNTVKFTKCGGF